MDIHTYPGQGLSASQLLFALNEELKRAAHSPSYTFENVSQLDHDISTALANLREWRNSFVPINRVPFDVLSLIPTHLSSEKDLFYASSVCRHWRKSFIQHAALWSRLDLTVKRSELLVKALLERTKGSPLDIRSARLDRADILALLSPRAQQFRSLDLIYGYWSDVQKISEAVSGPLPLLHTLKINAEFDMLGSETRNTPSLPLFIGAVNLKNFVLQSEGAPFLDHFIFPNLTTFELSTMPEYGEFHISELLGFLEASPTLQTVCLRIIPSILVGDFAQRVVVLPNVQTFDLTTNDGGPTYGLTASISCPSANSTLVTLKKHPDDVTIDQDMFPASASWNTIVHQHTRSLVEWVSFEITTPQDLFVACTLTFRYSDKSVIKLSLEVSDEVSFHTPLEDIVPEIFSQASRTVCDHPLLSNVKCLHFVYKVPMLNPNKLIRMANEVGRLFKSVGPLDQLCFWGCDLRSNLTPFLSLPEFEDMEQPIEFPPTKELMITHSSMMVGEEEHMAAVVELAKSQHDLGIPFEKVTIFAEELPAAMVEMLEPWVGEVDCYLPASGTSTSGTV